MRVKPIEVKASNDYRIGIKYADDKKSEIDLSGYISKGVFKSWKDYHYFRSVSIGKHGEIVWGTEIELCLDTLYLKLTNQSPEQLFPQLKEETINA